MDEVQPMVSAAVRRMVSSWEGRVPDEFGACHIVVSDFNVADYWLGCCNGEAVAKGDEDCAQFVDEMMALTEGERFAVVLRLAGRSEESILEG